MADHEARLASLVALALGTKNEDEARTSALLALRYAAKHGLILHAVPSVTTGPGWKAAARDEAYRRARDEERPVSSSNGRSSSNGGSSHSSPFSSDAGGASSWRAGRRNPYEPDFSPKATWDDLRRVRVVAPPGSWRVVGAPEAGHCKLCDKDWQVGHPVAVPVRGSAPPVHAWCAARHRYRRVA